MTEDIWTAARQRFDLGNPPGKDASYGDAVNWESLLQAVPDGEDLLLVTGDSDYISKLDDSLLADALSQEWANKKKSKVILYKNLTSLFKKYYPHIKLASELEKELAIADLVGSYTFVKTHAAIRQLEAYPDFSAEQARDLINAAVSNDQIYRIYDDEDVYEFFTQLAIDHKDDIDAEEWEHFWAMFSQGED
jgi:hypothetical protein